MNRIEKLNKYGGAANIPVDPRGGFLLEEDGNIVIDSLRKFIHVTEIPGDNPATSTWIKNLNVAAINKASKEEFKKLLSVVKLTKKLQNFYADKSLSEIFKIAK